MAGMADRIPVIAPRQFTRDDNTDHLGAPKPIAAGTRFSYGTAGFREHADRMPFIAFRVGYLASLRARVTGKAIGVMITASHNPEQDNGVKIVDPDGEMLVEEWEDHATELMNVSDDEFPLAVRALETQLGKDGVPPANSDGAVVMCGRDTRASGTHLADAVKQGVALFGTRFEDHGLLTTPQLHYIVAVSNTPAWGPAGEDGYYENLARQGVTELYSMIPKKRVKYTNQLHLDCANGVGAPKMRLLAAHLPEGLLNIDFRNENGQLNHDCGADFVKISRVAPAGFEDVPVNGRCAVFDGDADRLVYFYKKDDGTIELLDGDKIASLIAKFYIEHLSELNMLDNPEASHKTTFAIVQTAYANGASTAYMKEKLGVNPIFVPTGVKHLHHAAAKHECGIYFEANGHGTATFSDSFYSKLEHSFCRDKDNSAHRLWQMSRVINKFVGDAMADLLAVELILRHYDWSVQDWAEQLYEDAPSKQIKVPVKDRSRFKTTPDETRLTEPTTLQTTIDELVEKGGEKARAFVRPSGTENIVRVYAESSSQEAADRLAGEIEKAVKALGL